MMQCPFWPVWCETQPFMLPPPTTSSLVLQPFCQRASSSQEVCKLTVQQSELCPRETVLSFTGSARGTQQQGCHCLYYKAMVFKIILFTAVSHFNPCPHNATTALNWEILLRNLTFEDTKSNVLRCSLVIKYFLSKLKQCSFVPARQL